MIKYEIKQNGEIIARGEFADPATKPAAVMANLEAWVRGEGIETMGEVTVSVGYRGALLPGAL